MTNPTSPKILPGADGLYARLESLSKSLEGSGRLDEHDNPDAYATVLDAMNFVRSALAAPQPEPVALESVHLTRDTQGMCVVRVNGRVAIRDNGDIIDHMATLEWFAAPPAAPAEPCYCDRMGIGVPGVSCGDCPRDYKPAPAAPRPDEFTCPYCFDQGAAPAVREPLTREQQIAIREAHCNTASDEYFGARPHIDSREDRRIYEAGFKEGWESGIGGGGK